MRRRSERQQAVETIQNNLYAAGVSTVKAAKAHEEMFSTTLEALAEAYEANAMPQLEASPMEEMPDLRPMIEKLRQARQVALDNQDYEAFVAAESKLQHLDELGVLRLERQVRQLIAQQHLAQLAGPAPEVVKPVTEPEVVKLWTEESLKARYVTLGAVKSTFGIKARSWKEAITLLNQPLP